MPLNTKGKKILKAMKEQYGSDAKKVFYASKNKGVIKNVEKKMGGGLSGGKRFGPPPEKGPDSQGLKITKAYLGKEIKQPTETNKEFGTRHEVHTKLKESEIYRKGSKVSDASPMLKQGGQLKIQKAKYGLLFAVPELFERSQTVRDIGSQLGLAPKFLSDKYNKQAQEKKEELETEEQKKGTMKLPAQAQALEQGGMSCPYRRGGKTGIQGVSKIQVKGQKFTGVK
jgi:hypothetical protein